MHSEESWDPRLRRFWQALNAVLTVGGTVSLVGQAANWWSGLDSIQRQWLVYIGAVAFVVGGSAYLYLIASFLRARASPPVGPVTPSPLETTVGRLGDELKVLANELNALTEDSNASGLRRLIQDHGGADVSRLYNQTHSNQSLMTRDEIHAFQYSLGLEKQLATLAKRFRENLRTHGEFIDRLTTTVARELQGQASNPGLVANVGLCVENHNHLARRFQEWQEEFKMAAVKSGLIYEADRLQLRAAPL